jgi:poly(3-hydroxybutyrate) depolymerase
MAGFHPGRTFALRVSGAFAVWLAAEPTRAGSLVEFDNVPEYAKPARLAGYLAQPDGVGPFPAVVVLHGCGGISSHSSELPIS